MVWVKKFKNTFFVCLGCLLAYVKIYVLLFPPWAYVRQPHDHIDWATSMRFASINTTNPRKSWPFWIFCFKKRIFFCFIPMKIRQSFWLSFPSELAGPDLSWPRGQETWLISSLDFRWSCYFYLQFNQGTIGWTKLSNWFQPTEDFSSVLSRRWWCSPGGVGVVDTRWRWPHGYQMVSDRYRQTVAISAIHQIVRKFSFQTIKKIIQ